MRIFIEGLGYQAILSECDSFPVDPDVATVDNCLQVVDNRADLLVLVVGGRHGFETHHGRSVTNLEYLRPRAKGVPIYAFVLKSVLHALSLWRDNPQANFTSVVDSPKVFEFVSDLKGKDNQWVYPFETAQDITGTLRKQWANLFSDALQVRMQARKSNITRLLPVLSNEAFRLAIQKPEAWEYRLFSRVLCDELLAARYLRKDLDAGVVLGQGRGFPATAGLAFWLRLHLDRLARTTHSINQLMNTRLPDALGPNGTLGDAEQLVYVARRLGDAYREMIDWVVDLRRLDVTDTFAGLVDATAQFGMDLLRDIEAFGWTLPEKLEAGILAAKSTGEPTGLELTLTLQAPDSERWQEELLQLQPTYDGMW